MAVSSHQQSEDATARGEKQPEAQTKGSFEYGKGDVAEGGAP